MAAVGLAERIRPCIGRQDELAALARLTIDDHVGVVFLHGIPGIGKSALLQTFLSGMRGAGASVVALDCRTIEPTERGFHDAVVGSPGAMGKLVEHLAGLSAPVVLALDHYEVFRLMDTWLRQALAPALPAGTHLVLAGRVPPVAAWYSLGADFHSLPLGPLAAEDAEALLAQRGVAPAAAERLNRIARGHPLALTLAAAGVAEHPQLALDDAAATRVVAELARLYLEEASDPLARRALEAASVIRRATEPLLAAMLENPGDALRLLLDLPFVDASRDGIVVHDAVRDAIADYVRSTNPVQHRRYRRAAWRELRSEVRVAPPADLWRYTADMLYLIDNPVVREAFFPSGSQPLAVEPARPDDSAAMEAIAARHEGPEAAGLLHRWRKDSPESFSVNRDRDGVVVAFFALLQTAQLRPQRVPDPVVDSWTQHLRDQPVPKGQQVLGFRRWLDTERGELPCASQAASWLDVKRTYMALRPALRRIYTVVQDVPTYWPVVEKLGFRPVADEGVELDGSVYTSVVLDFGPGSVDGWLAGLVAAELGLEDEPGLDDDARELLVNGERVALTPLEFGLFVHLRSREGRTVSRGELLSEVWGTEFVGGSNVVDVVVRSLRGKLGRAAPMVETVRGSGYRLSESWRSHLG
ncbi:MAG: winged helix-turn-helix domain-containing protein [Gaiellaceae bacterium MAG52_C11]|nr:winged helix-turn-helix domain-containing protein [Candidatus Gaiellasilicea maunaloa]